MSPRLERYWWNPTNLIFISMHYDVNLTIARILQVGHIQKGPNMPAMTEIF